jgi:hypothetical protein
MKKHNAGTQKSLETFWGINKWMDKLAVKITGAVGTIWCAVIFTLIAAISLPEIIAEATRTNTIDPIIQWVTQTFLQLALLSIILRGQNIASEKQEHIISHIKDNTAKTEAAAERIEHIVMMIEHKAKNIEKAEQEKSETNNK